MSAHENETGWFAEALAGDRFEMWFQPIVDTSIHKVMAHECLVRLNHRRVYKGAEILEAAAASHQTVAFDSYSRRLAITSAAGQTGDRAGARYFINFIPSSISVPEQCMKPALAALTQSGLDPANIVFEAVEAGAAHDIAHMRRIRDWCRTEGFGFSLDNLGTGASAPQMVCDLRPDFIRLDRSLAMNIERPKYAGAVRRLVEVAARFDARVIAVGVEKPETMENLWLLDVQWMQGYLFGRPSPSITRQGSSSSLLLNPDLVHLSDAMNSSYRTRPGLWVV